MKPRVAILDDETRLVGILEMLLRREGYDAIGFGEPERAIEALAEGRFDLLLTDLRMPGMDGIQVLERVREIDPNLPVIVLTAHASIETAIRAVRLGAFEYVEKPFNNDGLRALVARALEHTRLRRENQHLRAELGREQGPEAIVAESSAMAKVLDVVRRAARSDATVLISGESGTGKERVARAVHVLSERVAGPFVAVNCKALAPGVLESELFGHERGAFTGAERARPGLFERAHQGTLFLDEIGEISPEFQAKLLRVLQEKRVYRVGGETEHEVDARIVAATNRDLKAEIDSGRFREDLYFRLAVIPIHLPPLRERREDVLPLARRFFASASRERVPPLEGWSDEAETWMLEHAWPGNARELENAIERGVVLARSSQIELEDLLPGGPPGSAPADATTPEEGLRDYVDRLTGERIRDVLRTSGGSRQEAAARLQIDRTTLYRWTQRLGIKD
ncbi:MAG: sigma-54-dependent Fis family transcriptional regulator [Deltaproteobacteria bacterium]|nr:sigma-54-dependent Fis family transcriptional regulator [Deltaproteobacteria bacterium]MBW2394554.1 sigma-54-dependent Fis family transcriptional regulator [Deltaproteobacteria bacterium]